MTSLRIDSELPLVVDDLEEPPLTGLLYQLGVYAVIAFLFIRFSRITDDWSAALLGFNVGRLGLASITSFFALIVAIGTGGLRRAFSSRGGLWLSAFSIWLVIATPFSYWRRGSQLLLTNDWSRALLVFVIVAGLLRTAKQCRQAMYAIGSGSALIALVSLRSGDMAATGRLVFGTADYLSNANDFAQLLLIGLPFVWLLVLQTRRMWVRGLAGVAAIAIFDAAAHTGSRSMLVGLIAMFLVALWKAPPHRRIVFAVAALVVAVWAFGSLPTALRQRYASVLLSDSVDSTDPMARSAAASREQRLSLLRESLVFTLRSPLFGVGPGVFEAAAAADARRRGVPEEWLVTHNTYTEVSSEAGIPALLFFVATLVTCFRTVSSLHRDAGADQLEGIATMAYCLLLSLVSFAVTAVFSSVAYKSLLPALAGLSMALAGAAHLSPTPETEADVVSSR